jgi:hypothetical protein
MHKRRRRKEIICFFKAGYNWFTREMTQKKTEDSAVSIMALCFKSTSRNISNLNAK